MVADLAFNTDPLGGAFGEAERRRRADAWFDTESWTDPNGRQLSQRVWLAGQSQREGIARMLREGMAAGTDPLQIAKGLEDYLTPEGRRTTTLTPRSGLGNYSSRRLARTEVTRAFGQATLFANERNPFVTASKWNLSGSHGKHADVCDERARRDNGLGPGVYRHGDFPSYPGHPSCRCFITAVTPDDTAAAVTEIRQALGLEPTSIEVAGQPRLGRIRSLVGELLGAWRTLRGRDSA